MLYAAVANRSSSSLDSITEKAGIVVSDLISNTSILEQQVIKLL